MANPNQQSELVCLRILIFIFSILLLAAAIMSFVFGALAKDNPLYGIIGVAIEHDVQKTLLISSIVFGVVCVVLAISGVFLTLRRWWPLQWIFSILLLISTVFYLGIGCGLTYLGSYLSSELYGLCEDGETDSDLQKALNELYTRSNLIFCTLPPTGCVCYLDHTPRGGEREGYTYISEPNPTIHKVQECDGELLSIYDGYSIDLYDLDEVIEYLNYFGEIENEHDCSGICEYQSVYYFSNSEDGLPDKRCYEPMKEDTVEKEILGNGISFVIIGVMLGFLICLQYALCGRSIDYKSKESDYDRSYNQSEVSSSNPPQSSRA